MAYALLIDWTAVVWVGVSFLILFITVVLLANLLRLEGISSAEVKAQIRSASQQIRSAEVFDRVGAAHDPIGPDVYPHVSESQRPVANDKRREWQRCVQTLRKPLAAVLVLWLGSLVFVSSVTLPGYGSLLIVLSALIGAAYYIERFLATRMELATAQVSQSFAHGKGAMLFLLGTFIVSLPVLEVLFEMGLQVSSDISGAPAAVPVMFMAGFGVLVATCGWTLLRLHPQQAAPEFLQADPRPPVLYLRSFARELAAAAPFTKFRRDYQEKITVPMRLVCLVIAAAFAEMRGRSTEDLEHRMEQVYATHTGSTFYGNLTATNVAQSLTSGRGLIFDEQLFLANLFNQVGPYIAIERPHRKRSWKKRSDVGSTKLRMSDVDWQDKVLSLIRSANMVVVEAGSSLGVLWELAQVVSLTPPRKVLLILPPTEKEYGRFCRKSLSIFPVALPPYASDLRFVMFGDAWEPLPLHGEAALAESSSLGVRYASVLQPFFDRNGFTRRLTQLSHISESSFAGDANPTSELSCTSMLVPFLTQNGCGFAEDPKRLPHANGNPNDQGALNDSAPVDLPNVPPDQVARALVDRGLERGRQGDTAGEISDYTAAINLPKAPVDQIARALSNRGVALGAQGDTDGEIADYTTAINLPGAPADQVARALVNRGVVLSQLDEADAAIADHTAAIELADAPIHEIARAYVCRAGAKRRKGDTDGEVADYAAMIELPSASHDEVVKAHIYRAAAKGRKGDIDGEIADCTAVINLPNAPTDQIARALLMRAARKRQRGDSEAEIADYTELIELPKAPSAQVARAFANRGLRRWRRGETAAAFADFAAAHDLHGAPDDVVYTAKQALRTLSKALWPSALPHEGQHEQTDASAVSQNKLT